MNYFHLKFILLKENHVEFFKEYVVTQIDGGNINQKKDVKFAYNSF